MGTQNGLLDDIDHYLRDLIREHIESFAERLPVRSIAVVGNAPVEPSAERAKRIDACDVVIRVNSFWLDPVTGPPSHGRKVHVVVFNRQLRAATAFLENYRKRAYLIAEGGHIVHRTNRLYPSYWPEDLGCWPIANRAVVADLRTLIDPTGESGLVVPTTGMLAAYLGHLLFPDANLELAGFSFLTQPDQTTWAHHVGGTVPVSKEHDLAKEGALMQSWIDTGRATLLA